MNRRKFLGFFGGAVAAGPGILGKAAATLGAEQAFSAATGIASGSLIPENSVSIGGRGNKHIWGSIGWAKEAIVEFMSGDARDRLNKDIRVTYLDPDLAAMHGMSMAARISIQKERLVDCALATEKSYIDRALRGEFE